LEKIESNEGKMSFLSAWCGEHWFVLRDFVRSNLAITFIQVLWPDNFQHFMSVVRKLWTPWKIV